MISENVVRNFVILLLVTNLAGFAGTMIHSRKLADGKRGAVRGKFFVYAFLTVVVSVAAYFHFPFFAMALVVAAIGLYEIHSVRKSGGAGYPAVLAAYTLLASGFILFSWKTEGTAIMLLFGTVATMDGFSQVAGQLFGRRKLAPGISPAKTIEGLIGGFLVTLACFYAVFEFRVDRIMMMTVAFIILAGVFGDLLASSYKRAVNIKDFSRAIPYHGGVLDRFDSLIMAGSVYFVISHFGMGL